MNQRRTPWGLLAAPMTWLVVAYLGALGFIFATAFFTTDPFTSKVVVTFTLENFRELYSPTYLRIVGRTLLIAALVTVLCMRHRGAVRVLHGAGWHPATAWGSRGRGAGAAVGVVPRQGVCLAGDPPARRRDWSRSVGRPHTRLRPHRGVLTLTYLWLPYMVLPVYSGFERLPEAHWRRRRTSAGRRVRRSGRIVLPS